MRTTYKDPIIAFCLPRSGSTLLMRLMKCCVDTNGDKVIFNGELAVLREMQLLVEKLTHFENRSSYPDVEEIFSPHHRVGDATAAIKSIAIMYGALCGAKKGREWGVKLVSYGVGDASGKFDALVSSTLKVFPKAKVVFLTRDMAPVVKSIIRKRWKNGPRPVKKCVRNQINNYAVQAAKLKDRAVSVRYEDLLSYATFSHFLGCIGLSIQEGAYNKIIANKLK